MYQMTSLPSEKYKNIVDGLKLALNRRLLNFGAIIGVYWRFNTVISTAENVLILNIIQVEENVSAFNAIFGIDIDGVNCFKS